MKFKLKGEQVSRSYTSAGGFQNKRMASGQTFFCSNIKTCSAARSVSKLFSAKISRKGTGEGTLRGLRCLQTTLEENLDRISQSNDSAQACLQDGSEPCMMQGLEVVATKGGPPRRYPKGAAESRRIIDP